MNGYEFALLMLAWVLAGASPGPATLAIAGTSMHQGRKMGLALAFGVICGSAFWGLAAGLGLGALMVSNSWIVETLRYISAMYLLWLAYRSMRSAMRPTGFAARPMVAHSLKSAWMKGLLLHLMNPKAILAWGAVFSVALPPGAPIQELITTGLSLMILSILLFSGYALLFSTSRALSIYTRMGRWIEGTFAVLFAAAGLRILSARLQ